MIDWLTQLAISENCKIKKVQYIFCSDEYLLQINKDYLDHDYYTDIITFPLSSNKQAIVSDIFVSIDRIKENADEYQVTFLQELHRVMAHGLLHLCGYGDATSVEKELMRSKENEYLSKI